MDGRNNQSNPRNTQNLQSTINASPPEGIVHWQNDVTLEQFAENDRNLETYMLKSSSRAAHPSLVSTNLTVILTPPSIPPWTYIHSPSIKYMYLLSGTLARLPTTHFESHSFSRTRRPSFFQHYSRMDAMAL
jgi:hypothetical protein